MRYIVCNVTYFALEQNPYQFCPDLTLISRICSFYICSQPSRVSQINLLPIYYYGYKSIRIRTLSAAFGFFVSDSDKTDIADSSELYNPEENLSIHR